MRSPRRASDWASRTTRSKCRPARPAKRCSDGSAGYYETNFSVNPMWKPAFDKFPNHPITRGVGPFATHDEWYFNMRWTPDAAAKARITPILVGEAERRGPEGPVRVSPRARTPHIIADSGKVETMMWVYERPDGGRSFGFTGGHTHTNWGDANQRRVMLNALLWIAKVEVPARASRTRSPKRTSPPTSMRNPCGAELAGQSSDRSSVRSGRSHLICARRAGVWPRRAHPGWPATVSETPGRDFQGLQRPAGQSPAA